MAAAESHIELGFRDLLFNSGVACMLLFIIFSVRVGKESFAIENSTQNQKQIFPFSSKYSLVINEAVEEDNYKSILAVEIQDIGEDQFFGLKNVSDRAVWSHKDAPDQFASYDQLTRSGTFYIIIGALGSDEISLSFESGNYIGGKFIVTAKIIDGKSTLAKTRNRRPSFQRSFQYVSIPGKEFIFRPTEIDPNDPTSFLDLFDIR